MVDVNGLVRKSVFFKDLIDNLNKKDMTLLNSLKKCDFYKLVSNRKDRRAQLKIDHATGILVRSFLYINILYK